MTGFEHPSKIPCNSTLLDPGGAKSGAVPSDVCEDPRLQSIIQNWPGLPEDIRSAVAALVTVGQHLPDSRLEARILALLRENPAPMTRKALASRLGLEGPKGRFGERIRNLIASGLIFEHDGEVSDDPRKFAPVPCQE